MSPTRNRSPRFLPPESSTLLGFVSFFFFLIGLFGTLLFSAFLLGPLIGWKLAAEADLPISTAVTGLVVGAGFLATAALLRKAKRTGGILALSISVLSILNALTSGQPPRWSSFVVNGLVILLVVLAWHHLHPSGRKRDGSPPAASDIAEDRGIETS